MPFGRTVSERHIPIRPERYACGPRRGRRGPDRVERDGLGSRCAAASQPRIATAPAWKAKGGPPDPARSAAERECSSSRKLRHRTIGSRPAASRCGGVPETARLRPEGRPCLRPPARTRSACRSRIRGPARFPRARSDPAGRAALREWKASPSRAGARMSGRRSRPTTGRSTLDRASAGQPLSERSRRFLGVQDRSMCRNGAVAAVMRGSRPGSRQSSSRSSGRRPGRRARRER